MNVLINGAGNIGTTLTNVLVKFRKELRIDRIFILKNSITAWGSEDLNLLQNLGCEIVVNQENTSFQHIGSIQNHINYVFDCTSGGVGTRNKIEYEHWENVIGASAQGTEKDFGISFMAGVNDVQIQNSKWVHIVSCNTHGIVATINLFETLQEIKQADFVVVRRSEDLGNHERLVSGNVVARHLDSVLGCHHSIDALDLFKTMGKVYKLTSSDVTTPSQLMHMSRFAIEFSREVDWQQLDHILFQNQWIASTQKFDSNRVFETGRRYGFQGRIFNHAILIENNLLKTPTSVKGWMMIPQEGNTILSTVKAFLLQTQKEQTGFAFDPIRDFLLKQEKY